MSFHNIIILIKSVWNKHKNNYVTTTLIYYQEKIHMNYLKNKFLYKIQILYYDRVDVSEGTDINKTSASKQCAICRYWYFLNKGFKFQTYVCNRCHDLLIIYIKLTNITILKIKNADHRCIITRLSKSKAIHLLQKKWNIIKSRYQK